MRPFKISGIKERFNFDGALKDLFERGLPSVIGLLTGGVRVRSFLNVELRQLNEKRVDLILLLEDGSILHIEIQSVNDPRMKFRMGVYYYLVKETYAEVPVRQVVLYVGEPAMNMAAGMEADGNALAYELIDIRQFDAESMMATGNPADLALALLAGDGKARLEEIVRCAAS